MVLGIRLILPLLGVVSACSAGPEQPAAAQAGGAETRAVAAPVLDRLRLGADDLVLVGDEAGCVLRVRGKARPLDIGAPCSFLHRGGAPEAAVEDYGDHGRVVMVIGPPAPASDYIAGMAETPKDRCASEGRPILQRGGVLALGDVMRSPAGYCPGIGMDEKFYHGIAHAKPFAARQALR
ncbi:MAG: hypothetical protein ABW173_08225 [Sphingomonas sp.]